MSRHSSIIAAAIAAILLGDGQFVLAADPPSQKPLEWHVLLIIKAQGDIKTDWMPNVKYQMTSQEIEAAEVAFSKTTPEMVRKLSNGRLVWKPTVVVSKEPLAKVEGDAKGTSIGPGCVADELKTLAPRGKYDGVFVVWKDHDPATKRSLKGGFGWTVTAADAYEGAGFSCVNQCVAPKEFAVGEVFLHEWLHQLEAYYITKGVRLPRGGLHGNDNYGFKQDKDGGWKSWYRAFINAELPEDDGKRSGLGEMAWRWGTMRDEVNLYLPSFITPERKRANLLTNPSFEEGDKGWSYRSLAENKAGFAITNDQTKLDKAAAVLRSEKMNDLVLGQKVRVNPKSRYLLTGWVRTNQVHLENKERKDGAFQSGALLSVEGVKRNASKVVVGTRDWSYVAHVFITGDVQEVEIGLRLGNNASKAIGTAWFDDLVLLEIALSPLPKDITPKK